MPPVTAERSPPASRMTGADSPVMADSSTEATPSMISPSEGIEFAGRDRTHVAGAQLGARASVSIWPFVSRRLAMVSERALRSVSACALPRPSAMASAKLANSTVNHSHSVICRLKPKAACLPLKQQHRGDHAADFHHEHDGIAHHVARVQLHETNPGSRGGRSSRSQTAFFFEFLLAICYSPQKVFPACHQQVLKNRSQAERREECQRAHDHNHADQQRREQRRGHRKRAQRRRNILLPRQIAGDGQHRNDHQEAADQHGETACDVVPERVAFSPAKAEPLLPACEVKA